MANRFPLVLTNNEIRELSAGDALDLTNNTIVNVDSIDVLTSITVNGSNVLESIDYADIQNTPTVPTALSQLTNDIGLTIDNEWDNITGTPTTLAGYSITDAATAAQGALAVSALQPGSNITQLNNDAGFITLAEVTGPITVNPTGDLQGSVFGDDSTLLVDGTNSNIPKANIEDSTNWDTAFSWGDHSTEGYLTTVAFADVTTKPTTISGYGITDAFDSSFSSLTGKPTTISGYGITDAFDGDYNSLTNNPTIPSALTDLGIVDGTNGQVLMTDGAGQFSFQTVGGGSVGTLQQVIDAGSTSTTTATFSGGIIVDAMQPSAGVGPTVHTGNFDITGTLSVTADVDVPNGTVTASQFATSGVGTPALASATNLDLEAANNIFLKINTATVASVSSTGLAADVTGYHTGDVKGSVFADDSTLLVDGVNGEIPGYVKIADLKTALQDGAGDYAAFKAWVLANL